MAVLKNILWYLLVLTPFWFLSPIYGQYRLSKFDIRTHNRLMRTTPENDRTEHILVYGKADEIKRALGRHGGIYKYGYGNIHSVSLMASRLISFSEEPAVEKIEGVSACGVPLMDTARIRNNVDSVHLGLAPLDSSLTGKGVIIGIIDGGIDWKHGDFINPATGKNRIRFIWDQTMQNSSNSPLPYAYGNQCNWIDIDNLNCGHVAPANDFGHGTCVSGIAAGNGYSMNGTSFQQELKGIAPEADIIFVRIPYNHNFLAHVADAVDYIFKKADALNKPCVINTSIGTYYGSHDGRDATTRIIEQLLQERKGRCLVAAAGNGGHIPHHLSYSIPPDSAYTFFRFNPSTNEVYFDLWADTADFKNARFAVGCNDTNGAHIVRTDYMTVHDFPLVPGQFVTKFVNLYHQNNLIGNVGIGITLDEDRYHIEFLVSTSYTHYLWRLQTSGSGTFDLWSSSKLPLQSADMVDSIMGVYIQYPGYRHPDYLKTMVSSWQCSPSVITVGNYSNRAGYVDRDGIYRSMVDSPYYEIIGKRFQTSSFGPTRTGYLKPDVMATGSTTICTGDAAFISAAVQPQNRLKVYVTQKHIRNGGTSMAAPVVAGIAALYFQQKPDANYQEVLRAITCTAVADSFTGATPNYEYGNGKVNAFAALTRSAPCIIYGSKDTACINYVNNATVDTGCVPKIYGCTDSTANNFNPAANIDDGSCDYFSKAKDVISEKIILSVHVNPLSSSAAFHLVTHANKFLSGEWYIRDVTGRVIYKEKFNETASWQTPTLSAGCYFYQFQFSNYLFANGKFIIP
ncbi:MAG: S8 family peptidase [Chitinophagales bacterium]|nr:S8 family peptidase [Chitinophagales bacterium]MDW8419552.1 S8 family serine peptidase [Chitinophagales bacterium]